jgi:ankyrin repeat domain-containing protein 50
MSFLGSLWVPYPRSIIINWLGISEKRPAVAFFYCEHDNPKKRDSRSILATLLYQVLRQLPTDSWDDLELDAFSTTQSVEKLCTSLKDACTLLQKTNPVFLIVDALDECDTDTRPRLLRFFVSLGRDSRLLLTSRKASDIDRVLRTTPCITITAKDVESDINKYVSRKVWLADSDLSDGPLEVEDPALLEEISRALVEGADGMWVIYIEWHVCCHSPAMDLSDSCGCSCRLSILKNKEQSTKFAWL